MRTGQNPRGAREIARPSSRRSLHDPQGRRLDYLRLAVTDRCNLRCRYCMPADGLRLVAHGDILSLQEMERLVALLCNFGFTRIRITGGEPLVRRGVVDFLTRLGRLPTQPEILLTTNGVLLRDRLAELKAAGLRRVNLSLDSLDRETYREISRRDTLAAVLPLLDEIPAAGLGLKINMVVLPGVNDHEIPDFAKLARDRTLQVRFIEPMPFNGGSCAPVAPYPGEKIAARLAELGTLKPVPLARDGVADLYTLDGWSGEIGIIRGHTRTFCGSCSRLRIDPRGGLRTCLYGEAEADLRTLLRKGAPDAAIEQAIVAAVARRHPDGRITELKRTRTRCDSMANIGG